MMPAAFNAGMMKLILGNVLAKLESSLTATPIVKPREPELRHLKKSKLARAFEESKIAVFRSEGTSSILTTIEAICRAMRPEDLQKLYADRSAREGYVGDIESPRARKVAGLMSEYREPKRVLDVGCANGALLKSFTSLHDFTGVDIGEQFLETARKNGYRKTVSMDVSTQPLPFDDKTFDVVFCGECIEHIVDTDWLYCEINRVLKAGGHFLLTFPNVRTPVSLAMMLLGLPPMYSARYRAGHVRDFTAKTMKIALANNGFQIDKMVGGDFYLPKLGTSLSWLATLTPSWASTVVTRAIKTADAKYSIEAVETTDMA